jgi:hypothetical protein
MNTFKLNGPGPTPEAVQTASDQHHYALLVLAGFALIALVIAVVAGSKPAATAVAICGIGALLIFLLIDLPDAGKVGTISNFTQAKANPQTGFWLELAGALVLAICGGALATLNPDQLQAFARSTADRRDRIRRQQEERHPRRVKKAAEEKKPDAKPRPRKASRSGEAG